MTCKVNLTFTNLKLRNSEGNGASEDLGVDLDHLSCLSKCISIGGCLTVPSIYFCVAVQRHQAYEIQF